VADPEGGTQGTFTQEQVDAAVKEALAEAKGEHDTAFQKLWAEAKEAKRRAKAWEGLDPEQVQQQLDELAALRQESQAGKVGITKEKLEQLRADIRAEYEKDYGPVKAERDKLSQEIRSLKLDSVVKSMMGKHGVRADRVDALFRLSADAFDLTDDGAPMLKNSGGDIEKYIRDDLAKTYPEFYAGSGSSGGGASKSSGGAGASVRAIKASDKAAFIANLDRIAAGQVEVVQE
jgi:hypothetical protein